MVLKNEQQNATVARFIIFSRAKTEETEKLKGGGALGWQRVMGFGKALDAISELNWLTKRCGRFTEYRLASIKRKTLSADALDDELPF